MILFLSKTTKDMKSTTKDRYDLMQSIIDMLGDKGREMRTNDLNAILKKDFGKNFKDERFYNLYFNSQLTLLEDMKLIAIRSNLVGLTGDGTDVYETEGGLMEYIKLQKTAEKLSKASSIASIFSTVLSGLTFVSALMDYAGTYALILGVSGFIAGFSIHKLSPKLTKILSKFQ